MNIQIRLTRQLYDQLRADLSRPHRFAAERIGFLRAKVGNREGDPLLVLFTEYHSVADEHYIDDPRSGARINSTAIRSAMQGVIDSGHGAFHVHIHEHHGRTGLSPMDRVELPRIVNSFHTVGPKAAHGIFLLSLDHCVGFVRPPGRGELLPVRKVSVVGFPLGLML